MIVKGIYPNVDKDLFANKYRPMPLTKEQLITLSLIPSIGIKSVLKVGNIAGFSPMSLSDLLSACKEAKVKMTNPIGSTKVDLTLEVLQEYTKRAENLINLHEQLGIGILTYYEDAFPSQLRYVIDDNGRDKPPIILYYKGSLKCLYQDSIAIIGSREVVGGGVIAAKHIAHQFASRDLCIVSGLAIGCDTLAHEGALAANGSTVAFLAHGLDSIYPKQNQQLATEILEHGGLLVSEYPIGTPVSACNLVIRDRLQAGLSKATIVIQTDIDGGSMHAALATLKANKPLYVAKYKDDFTSNHHKTQGNEYLKDLGAKYLSGDADFDAIANYIKKL